MFIFTILIETCEETQYVHVHKHNLYESSFKRPSVTYTYEFKSFSTVYQKVSPT